MKNRIAIVANGEIKNKEFNKVLEDFDIIICADGGANKLKKTGIKPGYIIGDLDSINSSNHSFFKKSNTKIIKDTNQDKTDLELAIELAETLSPSEITIFGAIGKRIDHTLANLYCLDKINPDIKSKIVDNHCVIELVTKDTEINGSKNDIISVIPISDVTNLNYDGFKWNVKNLDTKAGWFGLSNKLEKNKANISFSKGKILIVRVKHNDD